jgi:hypothetical protein
MMIEGMQANNTKAVDKEETVEVLSVEGVGERTQPFSFLTLSTVEGRGTKPADLAEQATWEAKVEKFMQLSDTYSTRHAISISGELCYMVDQQLYKDILLAVAARKQNEKVYEASIELSSWRGIWGRLRAVVCE